VPALKKVAYAPAAAGVHLRRQVRKLARNMPADVLILDVQRGRPTPA
jgi:hypothetical protein